jgi:hypothetical protein
MGGSGNCSHFGFDPFLPSKDQCEDSIAAMKVPEDEHHRNKQGVPF